MRRTCDEGPVPDAPAKASQKKKRAHQTTRNVNREGENERVEDGGEDEKTEIPPSTWRADTNSLVGRAKVSTTETVSKPQAARDSSLLHRRVEERVQVGVHVQYVTGWHDEERKGHCSNLPAR